jgi:quercetin dioxygenase-like cupin family protein
MENIIHVVHIFEYGGLVSKVYKAKKGEGIVRHQHDFEHLTICYAGSCVVRKEGKEMMLTLKEGPIKLPANEWHEIEALEDGTVFANVLSEGKY